MLLTRQYILRIVKGNGTPLLQKEMEMEIEAVENESLPIESENTTETEVEVSRQTEVETKTYVQLEVAAKMADRSTRTIRKWLKTSIVTGKKEDPENTRSKWLIDRHSLMAYLATEANPNPPRKSGNEIDVDQSEEATVVDIKEVQIQSTNEEIEQRRQDMIEELEKKQNIITKQEREVAQLKMQLEMSNFKLEQKDHLIEAIKDMQPNHNAAAAGYERRISDLMERLSETEKELSIVSDRYAQECSKGILARIFTQAQEFKLLTDNKS